MKKQIWILPAILILALLLAACGVEEVHEVAEPIDREAWPTSVPTEVPASPTPFPEFDFSSVTATPAPAAANSSVTADVSDGSASELLTQVVDAQLSEAAVSGDALMSQIATLLRDHLSPVSVGLVKPDSAAVLLGPGAGYGTVKTLERSELVGVLGQNSGGDWLYVIDAGLDTGWLPATDLRVTGSIEGAPVLPPDPIAALLSEAVGSSTGGAAAATTSTDARAVAVKVDDLEPVATALVSNSLANMRRRPGVDFNLLDTLSQGDEVAVLALNQDRLWALVETSAGQAGWVSVEFLEVDGDLSDAPEVISLTPGADFPADQVAPIVSTSGQPAATASGESAASTAAMNVSAKPVMPSRVLAPVAEGRVNRKVDLLREPNPSAGLLATLIDEPVTVLAVNDTRDWAVIQTTKSRAGWLPVDSFILESGSLENAYPVVTGWVQSNELELKSGPGIYHNAVGVVAINNLVAVLAKNDGDNWVLVEPLPGGRGWISPKFLTMMIPLAEVPPVSTFTFPEPAQAQAESEPAVPLHPAKNLIALQTSSGGDIMLINADGSNLRRLTHGIDPVLSPDGEAVAFTRWDEDDQGSLWTINVDGGNERFVLGEMRKAKGPDWSPDAAQVVLNYQHGGRLEDKTINIDLTKNPDPKIPWNAKEVKVEMVPITANGKVVGMKPVMKIILPPDPFWGLRVINLADGDSKDVDGGTYAFRPAWDPGQDWHVVSDGGHGLLGVDVNRPEYRETISEIVNDGSPVFSPDGRYLAATSGNQSGNNFDIYRLNADGSGRVRLTQTPLWATSGPDEQKPWNNVAPAWSPDGTQIAFLTDRTGRWEIWVMNADGSDQRPMFSDEINDQLAIQYNFVDERVLSWR